MTVRDTTEQMNCDMFDGIERKSYPIGHFSSLEINQAKESFNHNGYKAYESEDGQELSVKNIK